MTDEKPELDVEDEEGPGGFGSLGSILFLLVLTWAAFRALVPLNDNSFFTHLATGRLILESGSVPSEDPYTFTAAGHPWTVQSWLASIGYAGAERLGGIAGIRLVVLAVHLLAAMLLWRLTAAVRSAPLRLLLVSAAMVIASGVWSERPYMIGFIGLALLWLALEADLPPWVLLPTMWIWANTHGSFPLAFVLCATVIFGEILDNRAPGPVIKRLSVELRVTAAVVTGTLLAVASPLGLDVLLFPLRALTRSETFRLIVEWQSPEFTSTAERMFLLLVAAAIASLVRTRRWRHVVPVVVFVLTALLARRNVVMALPIVVPAVAAAIPTVGSLRSATRPVLGTAVAAMTSALLILVVLVSLGRDALGLGGYPVRALALLGDQVLEERTATQDFTGNLLEALDGPQRQAFFDDRADMFPVEVVEDFLALNNGRPDWEKALDDRSIDYVVWERAEPVSSLLASDGTWQLMYSDTTWMIACRRASSCDALLGDP